MMFRLRVFVNSSCNIRCSNCTKSIVSSNRSKENRYLVRHQPQQYYCYHQLTPSSSSLSVVDTSKYNHCSGLKSLPSCYILWNQEKNNDKTIDSLEIKQQFHHHNHHRQLDFRCRPIRYFSSSSSSSSESKDRVQGADAEGTKSVEDETTTTVNKNENDGWIPPNRPLSGDQGYHGINLDNEDDDIDIDVVDAQKLVDEALFQISDDETEEEIMKKLEEVLALEEELEKQQLEKQIQYEKQLQQQLEEESSFEGDHHINPNTIDWMETRREKLGLTEDEDDDNGMNIGKSIIPIHEHVLLTNEEITTILEYMGGTDLTTIMFEDDSEEEDKQDLLSAKGVIFCTAPSTYTLQTLSKSLIDHMRIRNLHKPPSNVPGSQINTSKSSSSFFAQRRQQQQLGADNIQWDAIDCSSYIVHIMDEKTRHHLQLEDLWSGNDPLWEVNILDDDAVDDYIATNPVPISYGRYGYGGIINTTTTTANSSTSKQLLRQGFVDHFVSHRPVIPTSIKQSQSRAGKKWKRQNRKNKYEN